MQPEKNPPKLVKIRSLIPIYYSTTTNTAKKIAFALSNELEENDFIPILKNVGEYDPEEILQYQGPLVMVLATYGNGGSPNDGIQFREWMENLKGNTLLQKVQFSIMALGNSSFEHFCGNGRTIRECMLGVGASQLIDIQLCNSSSTDNTAEVLFPAWSKRLIEKLVEKYELKEIPLGEINKKFTIEIVEEEKENWEQQFMKFQESFSPQLTNYLKAPIVKIVHVKQMRKNQEDGRSALWVRLEKPENFKLQPGCNVSVFPLNIRKEGDEKWKGSVKLTKIKKKKEIHFPSIPMEEFWKLSNFSQLSTVDLVKNALKKSEVDEQIKENYKELIKDRQSFPEKDIRCQEIYDNLKPDLEFVAELGINTVRPYTLSSWDPQQKYFDFIISVVPKGLACQYFKSNPASIRAFPIQSQFYVPKGRPIVMIANGSGIAPFRSITEYILKTTKEEERRQLHLYYGIQNIENDFYFGDEWLQYEKEGKIRLRIAESRRGEKKTYVQNLLCEDREFLMQHLMEDDGVVFVCGGIEMAKCVDTEIFEAIKLKEKIPFKAFKLSKQFLRNKRIVKEVYH